MYVQYHGLAFIPHYHQLALVAEVVHSAPARFAEPARFAGGAASEGNSAFPTPAVAMSRQLHCSARVDIGDRMAANFQFNPVSPAIYERAFLRTVLSLRGVSQAPTDRELEEARSALRQYELGLAKAGAISATSQYGRLRGRLAEPAAVEQAFMFVRYHTVLPPNATQLKALNDWLAAGRPAA